MICDRCKISLPDGSDRRRCQKCRDRSNLAARNRRRANPEKMRIHNRLRHQNRKAEANVARSFRSGLLRLEVLKHYGGLRCELCSEARPTTLTIDHIGGGGKQHRRECGRGTHFYSWLKNNNYPSGYRVLCSNCNVLVWLKQRRIPSQNKAAIYCRNSRAKLKRLVMDQLGTKCKICSNSNFDLLTVHHKNNDGKQQRDLLSKGMGGAEFYRVILKRPELFSELECRCFSCNDAESWRGLTLETINQDRRTP